jgi:hypothetical protein
VTAPLTVAPSKHRRYTRRQKATAVIAAEFTSQQEVAEQTGIPRTTIAYWMEAPEFVLLRQKTREDLAEESKALAHKALGEINRRLAEFEPRDLTILYGVLTDKSQLLSGFATGRLEHRELLTGFDDGEIEGVQDWLREQARMKLAELQPS